MPRQAVGATVSEGQYTSRPRLAAAGQLQRAGCWDLAVELLAAEPPDPAVAALRAEILVDRHWWRPDRADQAAAQVVLADALPPGEEPAMLRDVARQTAQDLAQAAG